MSENRGGVRLGAGRPKSEITKMVRVPLGVESHVKMVIKKYKSNKGAHMNGFELIEKDINDLKIDATEDEYLIINKLYERFMIASYCDDWTASELDSFILLDGEEFDYSIDSVNVELFYSNVLRIKGEIVKYLVGV